MRRIRVGCEFQQQPDDWSVACGRGRRERGCRLLGLTRRCSRAKAVTNASRSASYDHAWFGGSHVTQAVLTNTAEPRRGKETLTHCLDAA